ncbi:uncharacterized protein LOC131162717 [Malania oleifera]|uniref:uncharacterized protein LOC131162717 n=1 Tax=Malania oleifera TaxID=397392 RepID=UPI0025AE1323|nr:uncharacterized protein LOC131162717 [Malania oleifera]
MFGCLGTVEKPSLKVSQSWKLCSFSELTHGQEPSKKYKKKKPYPFLPGKPPRTHSALLPLPFQPNFLGSASPSSSPLSVSALSLPSPSVPLTPLQPDPFTATFNHLPQPQIPSAIPRRPPLFTAEHSPACGSPDPLLCRLLYTADNSSFLLHRSSTAAVLQPPVLAVCCTAPQPLLLLLAASHPRTPCSSHHSQTRSTTAEHLLFSVIELQAVPGYSRAEHNNSQTLSGCNPTLCSGNPFLPATSAPTACGNPERPTERGRR